MLASSAKEEELDHYRRMLDVDDQLDGWTSSADVDTAKPAPDIVYAALEKVAGIP